MAVLSVKVKKLSTLFSLLSKDDKPDVWGRNTTEESVRACLDAGILETRAFSEDLPYPPDQYNHSARIAFLILNQYFNPIHVEVAYPVQDEKGLRIIDGHHRVVAAILGQVKTLDVQVKGELAYAKHLLLQPSGKFS